MVRGAEFLLLLRAPQMLGVGWGEAGREEDRIGKEHPEAPRYWNIPFLIQGVGVEVFLVGLLCKPYLYFVHSLSCTVSMAVRNKITLKLS